MMSVSFPPPVAVNLLDQVIENVRPLLVDGRPTKERIRILWAAAKKARDLAAADVIHDVFMALAVETSLIDKNGRWTGDDVRDGVDVAHVIVWALRGWNPFQKGRLNET
jgi:hypothetical protein